MVSPSEGKFTLVGGDVEFGSRTKNVFAELEALEAKHSVFENTDVVRSESEALLKPDPLDDDVRLIAPPSRDAGKFLAPCEPPQRKKLCRSGPDFEVNPSKWKMYDLSDVSTGDMSEGSNTNAAHEFLRSRCSTEDSRTHSHSDNSQTLLADTVQPGVSAVGVRHVFHKPKRTQPPTDATERHQGHDVAGQKRKNIVELDDVVDENSGMTSDVAVSGGEAQEMEQQPTTECFVRHSRGLDRRVRHREVSSDDDDDSDGDNINSGTAPGNKIVSMTSGGAEDSSDSDDFSELAQVGSESDSDEEIEESAVDVADSDASHSVQAVSTESVTEFSNGTTQESDRGDLDSVD
jgi:hypothetical protein